MLTNCSDIMSDITVPLTTADRQLAQVFADAHPDRAQAPQIYANTLAVQALQAYFRWMQVPVDLDQSRSQHQPAVDVADLYLPELGQRVECCVVQGAAGGPGAAATNHCQIAPTRQTGRLGYVAVAFDQPGYEAKLLGFLPQAKLRELRSQIPNGQVGLTQFEPLDELLVALTPQPIALNNWLQGHFSPTWQALTDLPAPLAEFAGMAIADDAHLAESLLAQLQSVPADDEETRWKLVERLWSLKPDHPAAGVRRGVDLGLYLDGAAIALVVSVLPKPNGDMAVLLRVYPTQQAHLPAGLQLMGLYESGEVFLEATARHQDNYIQLKFSASVGERFGVQVRQGDGTYMEHFMV